MSNRIRLVAGVLILVALAGFAALLAPAYWRDYKFGQFLDAAAEDARQANLPEPVVRARVRSRAAAEGIPLLDSNLKLVRSSESGGWYIEARYVVPVDLYFYAVDLHFRPRGGVR